MTMDERAHSLRNGLFCCLVFLGCYLLAWPVANMGFMDGWSYIKTAQVFAQTGHLVYNGWATAMLGWMIPWGALFIKVFGFSFMAVKLSTLPVALVTLLLFHSILKRFEITPRNAVIGTLTLGLSPLFLPLSATFMTDIPGVFVVVLCLFLCQRAVVAQSDRAAIGWLVLAAVSNVVGGTARQVAWLGVLVMVPCTGWLLRKRRGVLPTALGLWALGLVAVLGCMHWFAAQPYSIQMPISPVPAKSFLLGLLGAVYTADLMFAEFLVLLLAVFPVLIVWLSKFGKRPDHWIALFCFGALPIGFLRLLYGKYAEVWPPTLVFSELPSQSDLHLQATVNFWNSPVPYFAEALLSLVLLAALLGLVSAVRGKLRMQEEPKWKVSSCGVCWLLGPYSVSYFLLLLTLGWQWIAFERYVIGVVPCAIIVSLWLHQRMDRGKLPTTSIVCLVVFAGVAVAGTHDWFARQRARLEAIQELRAAGVSRSEIEGGWEYDGWTQIRDGGYVNDPRIKIPARAYRPHDQKEKEDICPGRYPILRELTVLRLRYSVGTDRTECYLPSSYHKILYLAWLPPFWRTIRVERIRRIDTAQDSSPGQKKPVTPSR